MKKIIALFFVLLLGLGGAYVVVFSQEDILSQGEVSTQGDVTVYIETNQLMTNELLQWYDVFAVSDDAFVGFFTLEYDGSEWRLAQLTPHSNRTEFDDNIEYIIDYAEGLVEALNGDNKVYLPIIKTAP